LRDEKLLERYDLQRVRKRIDWCEMTLQTFLEGTGKKSMSLPYGKLQRRDGIERIDMVLEETFVDWATKSDHEWLLRSRTTVRPDKIAIKRFVKNTGEMPPGVEVTKNEESFSAKPDPNACRNENPDI
jgi:phage host-nuclease inhibitor protein Gam